MQRHGMAAVFRLIPEEIKTIKELDLPEQLARLIDVSEGLVLVTGPTGFGKSTTLASLIHTISHQIATVMQTGKQHGMITFEGAMQDLIHKGLMSKEDGANFLRRRSGGTRNLPGSTPPGGIRLAPNVASN